MFYFLFIGLFDLITKPHHNHHIIKLLNFMIQDQTGVSFGHDLIRHNLVVFRGGEGALQVLPPLVDVIPEARLNLVIYYLRQVK
jgi:hypothetical protein